MWAGQGPSPAGHTHYTGDAGRSPSPGRAVEVSSSRTDVHGPGCMRTMRWAPVSPLDTWTHFQTRRRSLTQPSLPAPSFRRLLSFIGQCSQAEVAFTFSSFHPAWFPAVRAQAAAERWQGPLRSSRVLQGSRRGAGSSPESCPEEAQLADGSWLIGTIPFL